MTLSHNDIQLRPFRPTDAPVLATLANNPLIAQNLRDYFPYPYALEDAQAFIEAHLDDDPCLTFAIVYQAQLCGAITLIPQEDIKRLSAEIGYWIGEAYWGKGIASQAVQMMTTLGFEQLQLVRIYAGIFEFNHASMRVLEKNGYQCEGILKKALVKRGSIWDEHLYAITR